ncbi:MAG: suppressor of fused domain protein [Candidatus Methylacidiphilales bacterium]|nr:suppressor of fused domain protein [Candidatus Methylacidiphilales bacterium]
MSSPTESHQQCVAGHYQQVWKRPFRKVPFNLGPIQDLNPDFCVLEFEPDEKRKMWTYATCCMSDTSDTPRDEDLLELHLHSPQAEMGIVELLYATAHYHRTRARLGLSHTVNLGRPWLGSTASSICDRGLVSLPYLDGPALEILSLDDKDSATNGADEGGNGNSAGKGPVVRCLWLIPVTLAEVEYKKANGVEALEAKFEELELNFLDPERPSVV